MKYWKIEKFDKELVNNIANEFNIEPIIAMLLTIRGINTYNEIQRFLFENEELDDPFLLTDMDKAVERIFKAVKENEVICIYGDYDADGVTSTAMLYHYLGSIGANVIYYIPSRENEGYGMNNNAIDKIHMADVKLIITVDNGISANKEIDYANSLSIDTVVTDHHTPPDILPNAIAIVNPHRKDCTSEFKFLSGVGVVFKLIMAMEDENLDMKKLLNKYSDIASLGTIGDIVSLTGENRILVKNGLKNIIQLHNKGITALLDTANLKGNNKITAGKLSFTIVPRINACGRLALSERSVELLLTDDDNTANKIAEELSEDNKIRQDIEKQILNDVLKYIEKNSNLKYKPIMVISGEGWHQGVIGIVSSKIKDIYGKPNIIITTNGEKAKGSGRSVEKFSLIDAITSCKDLLSHFGGHPMAVGLSMKTCDIDDFSERLNQYAQNKEIPFSALNIDCKLNPKFLTVELAQQISILEPFGAGNTTPVFGIYNMTLKSIVSIGSGKHLRLAFQRESVIINVMSFFTTLEEFPYIEDDVLDLAVTVEVNDYNNKQSLNVISKELKFSDDDNLLILEHNKIFEKLMNSYNLSEEELDLLLPSREDFANVFKFLRKQKGWHFSDYIICHRINNERINYGRLQVILTAMHQLSIIDYRKNGDKTLISLLPFEGKANLSSAQIMEKLNSYI